MGPVPAQRPRPQAPRSPLRLQTQHPPAARSGPARSRPATFSPLPAAAELPPGGPKRRPPPLPHSAPWRRGGAVRGGAEPRVAAAALTAQRARPRYAGGREEKMGRRRLCFRACCTAQPCSNGLRHSFKKTKQNTFIMEKKKV